MASVVANSIISVSYIVADLTTSGPSDIDDDGMSSQDENIWTDTHHVSKERWVDGGEEGWKEGWRADIQIGRQMNHG